MTQPLFRNQKPETEKKKDKWVLVSGPRDKAAYLYSHNPGTISVLGYYPSTEAGHAAARKLDHGAPNNWLWVVPTVDYEERMEKRNA